MDCISNVNKAVCMEAKVTLAPDVEVGDIRFICVDEPHAKRCPSPPQDSCTFVVNQLVCVQIPLKFSADATVETLGIVCDVPFAGPCKPCHEPCEPEPPDDAQKPAPYIDNRRKCKDKPVGLPRRNYIAPLNDDANIIYYRYRQRYI